MRPPWVILTICFLEVLSMDVGSFTFPGQALQSLAFLSFPVPSLLLLSLSFPSSLHPSSLSHHLAARPLAPTVPSSPLSPQTQSCLAASGANGLP